MWEPINTEQDITQLVEKIGLNDLSTSRLQQILTSASRHELSLSYEQTALAAEFMLKPARSKREYPPECRFNADRLGTVAMLLNVLDESEMLRNRDENDLQNRVEALEQAFAKINLGQDPSVKMQSTDALLVHDDRATKAPDKDDLFVYDIGSPEFDVCLHRMVASTGGTVEFGIKTDSFSRYFVRYRRLPALKIETMVAKALPKRVARTYAFYFELPRDLELLQQVLKSDAKLYLESLRNNKFYSH